MVIFKSIPEMFVKERDGRKPIKKGFYDNFNLIAKIVDEISKHHTSNKNAI